MKMIAGAFLKQQGAHTFDSETKLKQTRGDVNSFGWANKDKMFKVLDKDRRIPMPRKSEGGAFVGTRYPIG